MCRRALSPDALRDLLISPQNGATPLYVAAEGGHVAVVEALLQAGASTEAQLKVGRNRGGIWTEWGTG